MSKVAARFQIMQMTLNMITKEKRMSWVVASPALDDIQAYPKKNMSPNN